MEILTAVVTRNVNNAAIIITDEWKGYNNLSKKGFIHFKINHSKSFVDSNNPLIHTQNIENMWKLLRKFLNNNTNYSRNKIKNYLKEFVFRSKIQTNIFDFFINNIKNFENNNLVYEEELQFSEYEII